MSISDQVAALEAERDALKSENDRLVRQVERQRGAIEEGRAERTQLLKAIEKERKQYVDTIRRQQEQLEAYGAHFKSIYRGLNDLETKRANTAEKINRVSPAPSVKAMAERLAPVVTNGHANGHANGNGRINSLANRLAGVMKRDGEAVAS
jgi:predicted  nucleic acid-binding Zn-ribbon protein